MEALAPFQVAGEVQDPAPLPYLTRADKHPPLAYDIQIQVSSYNTIAYV
jgi:hypothetical protein